MEFDAAIKRSEVKRMSIQLVSVCHLVRSDLDLPVVIRLRIGRGGLQVGVQR